MKANTGLMAAAVFFTIAGAAQAGSFDGGYAGAYGRDNLAGSFAFDVAAGAFAGYNFDMGTSMVAGVEIDTEYDWNSEWGGSDLTGMLSGRAGYDTGSALLYGRTGVGYNTQGTMVWEVGAGVDYQISNQYLLRAEIDRVDPTAAGLSTRYNVKLGAGIQF